MKSHTLQAVRAKQTSSRITQLESPRKRNATSMRGTKKNKAVVRYPFKCMLGYCTAQFGKMSQLKQHIERHHGEDPYVFEEEAVTSSSDDDDVADQPSSSSAPPAPRGRKRGRPPNTLQRNPAPLRTIMAKNWQT